MINVTMAPEDGGRLVVDGTSYDPRIPYEVGEAVEVMIRPASGYQFSGWAGDVPAEQADQVPLKVTVLDGPQAIIAQFAQVSTTEPLSFDSDFDNGNGILRYRLRDRRGLVIEPQQLRGATNIWWHFKVDGIKPGEFVQLDVVHSPIDEPEFAGDCNPVYSYDGETWHRFNGFKSPFIQRFDAPSVEVSRNIPYPYGKSLALAEAFADHAAVRVEHLATSEEGRPVVMLRITDPAVADDHKGVIWMMARNHAFESHSSWYAEYFARWAASDGPAAVALRRQALIYVVPIMDVDNVHNGGAGKEQHDHTGARADFNRSWGEHPAWAAVRAAKRLLAQLKAKHDIIAFLDMHNPWYGNTPSWHLPPAMYEDGVRFAERWSAELAATGTGARWKHRFPQPATGGTGLSREPTLDTISSGHYAATTLFDEPAGHLCITIETAHWHDGYGHFITLASLQAYALALGRALSAFVAERG